VLVIGIMVIRSSTPRQVRGSVRHDIGGGTSVSRRVTPREETMEEDGDLRPLLSLIDDLDSEDESVTKERIMCLYKELQVKVRKMKEENRDLLTTVTEMKESATRETSEMLGRAQVQHYERDDRTYRRINALVVEKIFPLKKFIVSQRDLDEFTGNSSLGMIVMTMLKVEMPDRLPFWNAYKDIVADGIANRRTTITNDLKKVVMSKWRKRQCMDYRTKGYSN
jgi:hypothetical protein